jgi:hypothetical protein
MILKGEKGVRREEGGLRGEGGYAIYIELPAGKRKRKCDTAGRRNILQETHRDGTARCYL